MREKVSVYFVTVSTIADSGRQTSRTEKGLPNGQTAKNSRVRGRMVCAADKGVSFTPMAIFMREALKQTHAMAKVCLSLRNRRSATKGNSSTERSMGKACSIIAMGVCMRVSG